MDWGLEAMLALRALLAALLGGFIGWERERGGHEAGIRTYAAVCLGACVFSMVSAHVPHAMGVEGSSTDRIAAQVVTGIGFLGAGVILRDRGRVKGLTTAATIWFTASVGVAIAYGMYLLGITSALIGFALLASHHVKWWTKLTGESPPHDQAGPGNPEPQ